MNKRSVLKLIFICLGVFLVSFSLTLPCDPSAKWICTGKYGEAVQPLGIYSAILVLILVLLLFVSNRVRKYWKRFSYVFLPIVAIWIFFTPTGGGGMGPDREGITFFTAAIYGSISGLIILGGIIARLIVYIRSRRRIG